jgi:hypothetical protein
MSLIHDDRVNRIYKHQSSVEVRQPAKPVSAMGQLNQKHWDEEKALGIRQDKERHDLEMAHQEIKNRNVGLYRTDKVSEQEQNAHEAKVKALREKHQRQDSDLKIRQRLAKERLIKAGGGAA